MANARLVIKSDCPRLSALRVLVDVVVHGKSLDYSLSQLPPDSLNRVDRALVQALVYGALRNYFQLAAIIKYLLKSPLKKKDQDLKLLLVLGLYQLEYHRAPDYAVVSETVETASLLGKTWAKSLINAVLRNYLRQQGQLNDKALKSESGQYNAPAWIIRLIRQDWPENWQSLLIANSRQAPMTLRINSAQTGVDDYLAELTKLDIQAERIAGHASALQLRQACEVEKLPGFMEGRVSVQDASAQWAAVLLNLQPGQRALDACAAPGGKTQHMLELQPQLAELVAVEVDANRVARIKENLQRHGPINTVVKIKTADAAMLDEWWDGRFFDRILLDAPCSASGVIRRHPDIQLLRRESDIEALVSQQAQLLRSLWKVLAPGGVMVYCTCSVFKAENETQIASFLQQHTDARVISSDIPHAYQCKYGAQIFAGSLNRDGFYYACLQKPE